MNDRHPSGHSYPADASSDLPYATHGGAYDERSAYEQPAQAMYAQEMYAQPMPAPQGYPAGPDQGGYGTYSGYGGYDGYSTGTFENLTVSYADGDPLFGTLPGAQQPPAPGSFTGAAPYPTADFDAYGTYDAYAGYGTYDTGGYPTTAMWTDSGSWPTTQAAGIPDQPGPDRMPPDQMVAGQMGRDGQWDTSWGTGRWEGHWDIGQGAAVAHDYNDPAGHGAYGIGADDPYGLHDPYAQSPQDQDPSVYDFSYGTVTGAGDAIAYGTPAPYGQPYGQQPFYDETFADHSGPGEHGLDPGHDHEPGYEPGYEPEHESGYEPVPDAAHLTGQGHDSADTPDGPDATCASAAHPSGPHVSRARRRPKPRRSALLTVAVPSVCVMGVAGAATASVVGSSQESEDGTETVAAASTDAKSSPANKKLDSQLAGLSRGADDFADRASRTQERIDLKQRQAEERARKAKEAARKEAMRPKFVLPVKQHGLSATFGQGGVNWMSVHTGIDFPVSFGTPVMSATDGTITTKHQAAYGNVAIVTMADGTEVLYCHLSSIKIRTGRVKAGDTIAYSGSSGNSTGPHLHFEVRPHGGAAVDPQPWLRARGLNPN